MIEKISKRENELKSQLVALLRTSLPGSVVFSPMEKSTSGKPDIDTTWNKITTHQELKHATPDFKSRGIQELTMLRLARAGFAWYTVYYEVGKVQRTYIVQPTQIGKPIDEWDYFAEGINHRWVVDHTRRVHYDYNRT